MRKILLSLLCLMALPLWMNAQQVIEDFEVITLRQLSNGPNTDDSLIIVENPDPDAVNSSTKVLRFQRSKDGDPWAGFWSPLSDTIDMTEYKYVSAQVWKPRVSVVKFKVEGGTSTPTFFELESTNPQTKTDAWETLVFHFPDATGTYPTIAMLLDFNDPVDLTEDITIYVDNLTLRTDSTGGDSIVIEDFQVLTLNQLSNGPLPNDSLVIVPNPAPDDVNSSAKVLKFRRSSEGDVWAGFWSTLPEPVDMTENKFVLVKVWKPRISQVKFKVEGGTTTPAFFEHPSVRAQTKTEEWEEMVFEYPDATGTYPTIAMLPDFSDPVDLTEDIVLYIDDITFSPTDPGAEPTTVKDPEKINYDIYPNPAKSSLYFENLDGAESISIFNSTGQQVIVRKGLKSSTARIDVSSLPTGIYVISVYDKGGNATIKKFAKE